MKRLENWFLMQGREKIKAYIHLRIGYDKDNTLAARLWIQLASGKNLGRQTISSSA